MRKNSFIVALLYAAFVLIMLFSSALYAKPVPQGQYNYKGEDGKCYLVKHYIDDVTKVKFTEFYIDGGGPHISAEHIYDLYAKPIYRGSANYKGENGKWYWVEHFMGRYSGRKFTKFYVHGDKEPHIAEGYVYPNYPDKRYRKR